MKDLGKAKFLLGLDIQRQPNGDVFLFQEKYGRDLMDKFGMQDCNAASTPLEIGVKFSTNLGIVAEGVVI